MERVKKKNKGLHFLLAVRSNKAHGAARDAPPFTPTSWLPEKECISIRIRWSMAAFCIPFERVSAPACNGKRGSNSAARERERELNEC